MVEMSRRFTVTATRGRTGWWVTECAEVGAVSQVRRLDQAADDIREAIAWLAHLPEQQVDIEVVPVLPDELSRQITAAKQAQAAADQARHRAAQESREAARALREAGLTLRDVGNLLGISFQRAGQLTSSRERDAA